jgi:Ca-activated chloride channel family protein
MKRWYLVPLLGGGAAIAAAVAIPNTIEARKHGNEAAAIGALKTLNTSQTLFREGDKEGDGTLDHTTTGDRYFTTNHAGVVYYQGLLGSDVVVPGRFAAVPENAWREATGEDLRSTFSIDVDTASYATVRQFLQHRTLPPPDAVRLEEMINAFDYAYAPPPADGARPLAAHVEAASCPWRAGSRLVRIGLKGREVEAAARPAANLVFLIDVSGSMQDPTKLPLVKQGLRLLADQLSERDHVAIVVYAGASGLVLPPTPGDRRAAIHEALDRLSAGGSTNGGAGIQLAYQVAVQGFKEGGVNRVILLTDGDWNVGVTQRDDLEALIAQRAKSGVFLTVLGFGMNHQDATLERLADRGDGTFGYIDSLEEARRQLAERVTGTLVTIARDVKVQVAWDPTRVRSYRLLGYENRALENADFADDAKDAGELGAGHTVTALYEVTLREGVAPAGLLGALELRWKRPEGGPEGASEHAAEPMLDGGTSFDAASADLRFASSVAAFGLLLRRSEHAGAATLAWARATAAAAQGDDDRRAELVTLIEAAEALLLAEPAVEVEVGAAPASARTTSDPLRALADAKLVDGVLGSGEKQGYRFDMLQPNELIWMAVASPVTPRGTGDRWFVTNHAGVIYYSTEGPFALDPACAIPPHAVPIGR